MAEMTLDEIDAALDQLRDARMSRLTKGAVTATSYQSGSVTRQFASLAELDGEIARLEAKRARITGCASGSGPIRVGFGGRI